jgi:hypothetical protein
MTTSLHATADGTARAEVAVDLGERSYPISIGEGLLAHAQRGSADLYALSLDDLAA